MQMQPLKFRLVKMLFVYGVLDQFERENLVKMGLLWGCMVRTAQLFGHRINFICTVLSFIIALKMYNVYEMYKCILNLCFVFFFTGWGGGA